MTNDPDDDKKQNESRWMNDMDGNVIEFLPADGVISIFAWTVTEDSRGRPHQDSVDTLNLTPDQAIEFARRLLSAATE